MKNYLGINFQSKNARLPIFLFFFLAGLSSLWAQVPSGMNYQAVVRDGTTLLTNRVVDVQFSLMENGVEVYRESQSLTTNDYGLLNAVVGEGTVLMGGLDSVLWENGNLELKVSADIGGGFVNLGATRLNAVPYSQYAARVGTISDFNLGSLADVDTAAPDTGEVMRWDGSKWTPGAGSLWQEGNNNVHYLGSAVGIRTSSPTSTLTVRGNMDLESNGGVRGIRVYGSSPGAIETFGPSGSRNLLFSYSGSNEKGFWGLYNSASVLKSYSLINSNDAAEIILRGDNDNTNVVLGQVSGYPNNGYMGVRKSTGDESVYMMVASNNSGFVRSNGPNGYRNASMSWLNGCNDCGYMGVYDANSLEAGMYVNTSGQGVVFGDIKNFRMEHPTQPGKEIWYASLEGPEAAAYERGTASLVNGQAVIVFSEHFSQVASEKNMTVILTPLSGQSKGLAVVQKTTNGFEVAELWNGKGTYDFDWEVKCVRKGFEDYRVVRDASESRPEVSSGEFEEHGAEIAPDPTGNPE